MFCRASGVAGRFYSSGMIFRLALVALGLTLAAVTVEAAEKFEISGVRLGENKGSTRFVLDINRDEKPRVFVLANPYRVVIDMSAAEWSASNDLSGRGVIERFRHGLFRDDIYRIVLDLKGPASIQRSFTLAGKGKKKARFVLDLKSSTPRAFDKLVTATSKLRVKPRKQFADKPAPVIKRTNGKRIIVIDAGHGGNDPGNLGSIGVHEKIITLKLARDMRNALNATGRYDAKLTRDKDVYINLTRRYKIARNMGADLFISVHADSHENKSIRGGSVYTLSEKASDREAAKLAARENKSDLLAGVELVNVDEEVSGILLELAQRETLNYSAQFAEMLVPEMKREVRMLGNPHRMAGLVVLNSHEIPSVLLESGFLSNRQDARFLNSQNGRKKISKAVRRAVDRYFAELSAMGR